MNLRKTPHKEEIFKEECLKEQEVSKLSAASPLSEDAAGTKPLL